MVFNTFSVGAAVTPSVIETYFSHYLNRKPLRQKPTAHISYHEGLRLIRQFLEYSSKHTVEDIQSFTGQWVPAPHWVKVNEVEIPSEFLQRSASLLQEQFGQRGVDKVGGKTWWQWRRPGSPLKAEWIEMKKDYNERTRSKKQSERVILYVHGGAYYFGSVDEHRYQMQRHARKLRAKVLAPRYRLAPQFPFPCGLYDCIAAYLYLLEHHDPSQILFGGDSAGGGMVLSMLVTLRDQGIALPAGAILLSPWVDLTHSFPSVAGDGKNDYIPPHGFIHRPSMFWPPPNTDEMKIIAKSAVQSLVDAEKAGMHSHGGLHGKELAEHERKEEQEEQEAIQGFGVDENPDIDKVDNEANPATTARPETTAGNTIPGSGHDLSIMLDGKMVEIKDQIQMYTTNQLLGHPLVSPVLSPSLGGLPPLLIQTGSGELLRDEQIYLAHKAANPSAYPPSEAVLDEHDPHRELVDKYPPTDVQLQVWDDLCHVPHTLSFTRPAKYMYRSVAQFGAWALAHAQNTAIDILDDDNVSVISAGSNETSYSTRPSASTTSISANSTSEDAAGSVKDTQVKAHTNATPSGAVGKAGDPLPPFKDHMIRQRVDRHGVIYPLALPSEIATLHLDPASIGVIKQGPVRKWLAAKRETDRRFSSEKRKVQKKRIKEMTQGYDVIEGDEVPPPTALAGRRRKDMPAEEKRKGKSWGLAMWSGWGSSHDESTLEREERADRSPEDITPSITTTAVQPEAGKTEAAPAAEKVGKPRRQSLLSRERPRSRHRQVTDTGQAGDSSRLSVLSRTSSPLSGGSSRPGSIAVSPSRPESMAIPHGEKVPGTDNTYLSPNSSRPHNGTVAYPFKLRNPVYNPSTATLDSQAPDGTLPATAVAGSKESTPEPAESNVTPLAAETKANEEERAIAPLTEPRTDAEERPVSPLAEPADSVAARVMKPPIEATPEVANRDASLEDERPAVPLKDDVPAKPASVPRSKFSTMPAEPEKVVENGEVKEALRPEPQTFSTAMEVPQTS